MLTHIDNVEKIRNNMPTIVRDVFEHCIHSLEHLNVSFAVQGSYAVFESDSYSDLDFFVVVIDHAALESIQTQFINHLKTVGTTLAFFRASHLTKPNLCVFYIKIAEHLIKLDCEFVCLTDPAVCKPAKLLVLHDPVSVFKLLPAQPKTDFNDIYNKFCVWMWFTYSKLSRGEFFRAARSIDYSREYSLLPVMRKRRNLPMNDGHCRVEFLFPPDDVERLKQTYPNALEKVEIYRALMALIDLFKCEWEMLELDNKPSLALFNEIKSIIAQAQGE